MLRIIFLASLVIIPFANPRERLWLSIALIISLFILTLKLGRKNSEKYDYDRENPNALVSGRNIAGTVYSSNVENTPGLGWIL